MPLDGAAQDIVSACRQPYPLPPDVRYVLDNILSEWGMDEGSYIALNLFLPRKPILEAVDGHNASDERRPAFRRFALGLKLMDMANEALPALPMEVRNGLALSSLQWLRRDLLGLAQVYAGWAFEDEVTGGAMKPWLRRRRIRPNGEVEKRTTRRLNAPAFIARTVKANTESRQRRELANRILPRVEQATALTDCLSAYAAEMEEQRERARREAERQIMGPDTAPPAPRLRKQAVRRERAVIRRSLRTASAVLSTAQIGAFARGECVRLPGATFDLAVRMSSRLAQRGHGTLSVQAVAPGTPLALASLCVYHERTPALDQLAALALAMGAGEEAGIVRDANITQMFPAGREHLLLAEREKRDIAARTVEPRNWTLIDRSYWSYAERRAREAVYWTATKHMWIERLAVFACGRRVKLLGLDEMLMGGA